MKSRFYHSVILIALCLSFALIGCGGGSGGGGEDLDTGLNYTGESAPAEVDENNATAIAAGALAAGQTGTVMTSSEASPDDPDPTDLQIEHFRSLNVPRILGDAARLMDLSPPLHRLSLNAEANRTISETEDGPCGGSVSYTLAVNDVSGEFNGTFTFLNYCDHGVTISGNARVAGRVDLNSEEIINVTFWFDNLTDGTMTMDGEMSMDFSGSPMVCTLECLLKDKTTGKIYWAKEYHIEIYRYADRIEVDISGRYYHPDHGYVEVSTVEVFVIHDGDDWPTSGILLMLGANNTRVRLTVIDETFCRIEADCDGDGNYEWNSGPLLWDDFEPFDQIEISGSFVQYRTYIDPSENRYQGYVGFLNDGQPIEASGITDIALKDPDQDEIGISLSDFYYDVFYSGGWNAGAGRVLYGGSYTSTGYSIFFPAGTELTSGNYTYEATTVSGRKLTQTRYFPGKLELKAVDSTTMVSEWVNGDLKLTWTNPDPGGPFDLLSVRLINGDKIYLIIRLPNTAGEVTIPQVWINNVKQLSNAATMSWHVLFGADESTTNNHYARSMSANKAIDDWDPDIPPGEIQNPGFEQGTSGWGMITGSGADCAFTIDADANEGTQAAKLTVNNDGYCALVNSTPIPINQTGAYKFNLYAKVSGDVDHLTIAIYKSQDPNVTPTDIVDFISPNAFSGDYQLHELSVDLSAGDYIRFELGIDNNAAGTSFVLFDSLELINN